MEKINFINNQAPALNATILNQLQKNIDKAKVEIDSVASLNNVVSKNLCGIKDTFKKSLNGITYSSNNGIISLSGTATDTFIVDFDLKENILSTLGTLTSSYVLTGTYANIQTSLRDSSGNLVGLYSSAGNTKTDVLTKDGALFRVQINSGLSVNCTIKPQIEKGSVKTDYAPYLNLQKTTNEFQIGNWAPKIGVSLNDTEPTVNQTENVGTYMKIGRYVFINFYIRGKITALNGTNNYGCVKNLPFPVEAGNRIGYNSLSLGAIYSLLENEQDITLNPINENNNSYISIQIVNGANRSKLKVTTANYFEIGGSGFYLTDE